ncbi:MAG: Hemerythrin [Sporanaerobacter sp.]|jgi:hemerythrin|uniref:bacteriohemerythrin n=1 Tax=Sporanaerobacter sp. TaxID=2010183 RepID=UPI003A101813
MFKWRDEFSVNVEKIDEQHKELFNLGSKLYTIVSAKDNVDRYDEIMEILSELRRYAIYHFGYEEELMKQYGYENYQKQKIEHARFIEKITSISQEEVDEKQKKVSMELITFIANWIENHILKSDMEYKEYFNSNGLY